MIGTTTSQSTSCILVTCHGVWHTYGLAPSHVTSFQPPSLGLITAQCCTSTRSRVTCQHTAGILTWFPCAAAAAAAPLSGWLASQLVKLPSAAPSAQAKLPSVTKSWRPSQDTSEPRRPWREGTYVRIESYFGTLLFCSFKKLYFTKPFIC